MEALQTTEVILIIALIIVQGVLAYEAYKRINMLKGLFQYENGPKIIMRDVPLSIVMEGSIRRVESYINSKDDGKYDHTNLVEMTIISASSKNDIDNQILNNINSYLIKNKGAIADYHLLKDVVDREVETLDGEINNELPAPLYLGLAATMLGIIFGLFSFSLVELPSLDDEQFDVLTLLKPLLDGVTIAMFASVIGLGLTTYLSIWEYRIAKAVSEKGKNKFLSFLQANLLPELVKTETSGITALNDRLKRFGTTLAPVISSLSELVEKSFTAVKTQQEVIGKIEKLDINKLSKANVTIFNKIGEMMESFDEFANYYQELNRSMAQTVSLTSNLKDLVTRTRNLETIATGIEQTFQQNKDLNQFLGDHLINIKSREAALQSLVDSSERNLKSSFDQMTAAVQQKILAVQNLSVVIEPEIKDVFVSTIASLEQMTTEQINKIERAFENARPQFEKLGELEKIERGVNTLASQGMVNFEKQDLLIQSIKELISVSSRNASELNRYSNGGDRDDLLVELKLINKTLSNGHVLKKARKTNVLTTVLLTLDTVGLIGIAGFIIYGIVNGLIIFW